jgi:CheY-like chemotaxis protein
VPASPIEHILIVEDDGDLLEVLKYVLEDAGYRVSMTEGGAEALTIAAAEDVNLILLDISMPDISGIEVAQRLRAHPNTADIRIVIHTGLAAAAIREQFTDYDCFIAKTEDSDALVAAIRTAMKQPKRTASAAI